MVLRTYVLDHWRGRHRLATTLLVSALGLRIGLGAVQSALMDAPIRLLIGFCLVANVVLLVWQVVGTVRASSAHVSRTGDVVAGWAGYATALIVTVLAIFQAADIAAALNRRQATAEPPPTARTLPISADGTSITLAGSMDYPMNTAFVAALDHNTTIRRVILASDGGLIFAARAIALHIVERKLDTHVDQTCSSACTIAFLAGETRSLGPEGRLGFHRYRIASTFGVTTVSTEGEIAKDRDFFLSRGVSAEFLGRALDVDHSNIWFPTRAELIEAGVITPD